MMNIHPMLARQVTKASKAHGELDAQKLIALISAAYEERDLDRRRADRANRLMAEELESALAAMEVQNLRFKAALDNMTQGLCLFDSDGKLAVCNQRFLDIYGLDNHDAVIGLELGDILLRSRAIAQANELERRMLIGEHVEHDDDIDFNIEQIWPDGRCITITRTSVADGGWLDTIADVTEAWNASAQIAHLARHDALTDLPNRTLLRERLLEVVRNGRRREKCAVMCLDLDRFKLVNDTLGHPIGDALLVKVSKRLLSLVRSTDVVARLGGDEFAIIQQHVSSEREPMRLAQRIISELCRPYAINGHQVQIGVSIGIDVVDITDLDPDEVLRNADLALYQAKADGRGAFRRFEPEMHALATERRLLEMDLTLGIQENQFEVFYQPQIDLKDGVVTGFEALVRWRHPVRGLVSPAEFIPVCEEMGLIDDLGIHVLETACHDALSWPDMLKVAVNLSAIQFKSGKLVDIVKDILDRSGLTPGRLELEITESVMLEDASGVLKQLRGLKRLGTQISLDDFGTGYSSLSYIRNFPFDRVKIDQSFVRELGANADSLAIIRAVAGLCGSLGINSTAEGVETQHQLDMLLRENCDSVQGYLFSKPVPASETRNLISRLNLHKIRPGSLSGKAA